MPLQHAVVGRLTPSSRPATRALGLASLAALASITLASSPASAAAPLPADAQARVGAAWGQVPMHFERNQGQTSGQVRFLSRGSGYSLFLTGKAEAVLSLARPEEGSAGRDVVRLRPVGAASRPAVEGEDRLPGRSNYFIGNDPARWRQDVPLYGKVRYRDVYPGIDLVYHGRQRQLEYDFVVAPGADPGRIRLKVDGARGLSLDAEGNLVVKTRGGEVIQHRPEVYQETAGGRRPVPGRYVLGRGRTVSFEVGSYDRTARLVIDPVLGYSTYLGGSRSFLYDGELEGGGSIAVDAAGNAYVVGHTEVSGFPTANPYQGSRAGDWDLFVTKLSPSGSELVYSTFLGGSARDGGDTFPPFHPSFLGIAVDASGSAYVSGWTESTDFPTRNAFQPELRGYIDGFVARLSPSGSELEYSTYLGGTGWEECRGIAVDASGSAYVSGGTISTDFPTRNAFQPELRGYIDGFVTRLSPSGSQLEYSTYLGGTGPEGCMGIAVDASGHAYVTGDTGSTDFPTRNAFQPEMRGDFNGFVTKLSLSGSQLEYSTYLGGTSGEYSLDIAVDASGHAYVTGWTSSTDFPTSNPFQASLRGAVDAFVTKLSAAGSDLAYSTYLGGSWADLGLGIAVDRAGSAHVTGETGSTNFPTSNPFQASLRDAVDAFVAKIVAPVAARVDFDGDTRADLLWRRPATGDSGVWLMDGARARTVAGLAAMPAPWAVADAGDLDGDGMADVVWQNDATGENAVWFMNASAVASVGSIAPVPRGARIAAAGDFDGNGKADVLLLRPGSGRAAVLLLDGATVVGAAALAAVGAHSLAFTGDLDDDGKADVAWFDPGTGQTAFWLMDGKAVASGAWGPTVAPGWLPVGLGDLDGDGRADLVWRDGATGEGAAWFMDGTAVARTALLPTLGSPWSIAGVDDFDGDGRADLFWRNGATGEDAVWFMDGATIRSSAYAQTVEDTGWHVELP